MCDSKGFPGIGWKGWIDVPAPAMTIGYGPWIDLSHVFSEESPTVPFFSKARFERIISQPKSRSNCTEIQMVVHIGTHVDAPIHYFSDGPAFHDIPLDRLHGKGAVWHIEKNDYGIIDVPDLERARPQISAGDIVAIDTGWSRYVGTPKYDQHPSFSVAAAEWLVSQRVKMLAIDFLTPDLAINRREKDFVSVIHNTLLSRGVLITEHLTNLESLAGGYAEFMFMALNIKNSDGAPARVLARKIN
jgi:kynurenine formamidase